MTRTDAAGNDWALELARLRDARAYFYERAAHLDVILHQATELALEKPSTDPLWLPVVVAGACHRAVLALAEDATKQIIDIEAMLDTEEE